MYSENTTKDQIARIKVPLLGLFTEAELTCITRAINRVWEACAYDLLQAVAEEKKKDVNSVTIPRAQVVEIALDAGRPEEYLQQDKSFPPEAERLWSRIPYESKIALAKTVFTYSSYGT